MATTTPTNGGVLAPLSFQLTDALNDLLVAEAQAQLERENPTLFFEPPCDEHVVLKNLTNAEERRRRALVEEEASLYEARREIWVVARERWVRERVAALFSRYAAKSLRTTLDLGRREVPADLRRWAERQLRRGAWSNPTARVYLFLTFRDLFAWSDSFKADAVDPLTEFNREREDDDDGDYDGMPSLKALLLPTEERERATARVA